MRNDPNRFAVISRDDGMWVATFNDGTSAVLPFPQDMKAGHVAEQMARLNPDAQIGVRSAEFGPNTVMSFGPVVWLKRDFPEVK